MHELDGVLHGQDMTRALVVHAVEHARQRSGFAAAGGARHQHQAPVQVGQAHDGLGDVHLVGIGQPEGDDADDGAIGAALAEYVGTETTDARDGEAEVVVVVDAVGEQAQVAPGQFVDRLDVLLRVGRGERGRVRAHVRSARLVRQRQAGDDEHVGSVHLDHLLE